MVVYERARVEAEWWRDGEAGVAIDHGLCVWDGGTKEFDSVEGLRRHGKLSPKEQSCKSEETCAGDWGR